MSSIIPAVATAGAQAAMQPSAAAAAREVPTAGVVAQAQAASAPAADRAAQRPESGQKSRAPAATPQKRVESGFANNPSKKAAGKASSAEDEEGPQRNSDSKLDVVA